MCTNHIFSRYKRKQKEKDSELAKLRKECDELRAAEIRALKAKKEEMKENEDIKVNFNSFYNFLHCYPFIQSYHQG